MEGLSVDSFAGDWKCENFQLSNLHSLYIMRAEILFRSVDNDLIGKFIFVYSNKVHISASIPKPLSRPRTRKI